MAVKSLAELCRRHLGGSTGRGWSQPTSVKAEGKREAATEPAEALAAARAAGRKRERSGSGSGRGSGSGSGAGRRRGAAPSQAERGGAAGAGAAAPGLRQGLLSGGGNPGQRGRTAGAMTGRN